MRVYVGAITHETNRFSPIPTCLADYSPSSIGYSDLVRSAEAADCEVIAGMCQRAAPSAPTIRADYIALRNHLVAEIADATDLDLILLCLHGAQVAEGFDDCEGDIVAAVRAAVGDSIPIGVLLDLHASISPMLLENTDLVTVIKEYPHTDFPATAAQLVDLGLRLVRGEIQPVTAFVPVPVFTLWHTPELPCRALVERARAQERSGEVLHISLVHGFPWSDVADAGAAVLVTTDGQPQLARDIASDYAAALWEIRGSDLGHYLDISAGINAALANTGGGKPVVIADAGDNPGAGTGSDATWMLREVLARGLEGVAMALFWDPAALADIVAAGAGASLDLCLGGHSGSLAGEPVRARATVLRVNLEAEIDAMPGYPPLQVGTLAAIEISGVVVVVGAYREQVFGPRVFTTVGIDPRAQRVLVVKSAQHFYAAFAPMASRIIYCDSPCSRTIQFSALPFEHRRSPMWPLDECDAGAIPAPLVF